MADFPGPNSALFGSTGFVGTTLRRTLGFEHHFNSKNMEEARGATFDVVVFCSMPAVKWMANKEPAQDLRVLRGIEDVLGSISCKRFVLISTIDIYVPPNSRLDEEAAPSAQDNPALHAYGKHRAMLEQFVRTTFPVHAIVRLPALFGLHLRKNYVYDILNGNNVAAINRNSAFQWYDMSRLDADLRRVLSLGLTEVNLFPEPVGTEALIELIAAAGLLPEGVSAADVGHAGAYAEYDICTKHGPALGGPPGGRYCASAADVRAQFARFLAEWAMMRRTTVSCIAWDEASNEAAVDLLKLQGVRAIEVAPTRFWEWDAVEAAAAAGDLGGLAAGLAADLERWGLQASSLQAILYKKPDLVLFGSPEARTQLGAHMRMVVDLAAALREAGAARSGGVVPIVFGAPKNRVRPEGMTEGEADDIFVEVFKPLAEYAHGRGCSICVEPNAPGYGCNYITTSADAKRLVERVSHPGLRVHLDTGCMTMAGEDVAAGFEACAGLIGHAHVSEPFLANYLEPKVDHARAAAAMKATGYGGLVSLELLTKGLEQLAGSLAFYQRTYRPLFDAAAA
jgi:sugar phosphate isomerase/epimerase